MAEIADVTVDNFDSEVLGGSGLLLVYFYAAWCKPCQETEGAVQAAADEVNGKMRIVQVNTDKEEEIVTQQDIRTVPTFRAFKDGEPVATFRGPHSKLDLLGQLSNIISGGEEEEAEEATEEAETAGEPDDGA